MTDDIFSRAWHEILARPGGPLALRFYLQPFMASLFALRDGLADARTGQPPYFWTICFEPGRRRELIRSGWQSIAKVFCIAVALDVLYQLVVLKGLRPLQTMLVAVVLAIVPYLLIRGPVSRIVRTLRRRSPPRPRVERGVAGGEVTGGGVTSSDVARRGATGGEVTGAE